MNNNIIMKRLKGINLSCMISHFRQVRLFATPWTIARQAPLSMGFSSKNTRVVCHALFQGNYPTQGSNPGLPHCRQILYHLRDQGSPRILEWVAYFFSRGASWPRNRTEVSCIAGRFFTSWATREAHRFYFSHLKKRESQTSLSQCLLGSVSLHGTMY